jgi:putative ABC transport system ATP-binding protein
MTLILCVTDLRKHYFSQGEPVRAVDGVSLGVNRGEFVVIMGASGSGKSTLLHLIGGLDKPTSGSIAIEGQNLAAMSDRDLTLFRRRRLGIIFQAYNLLPTLTAVENVMLPSMIDGADNRRTQQKAHDLLTQVNLDHRLSHRPQAMSGGEQQRVAIARAMMNDPALILADEPTGNLDSHHGEAIWKLLGKLVKDGNRTVIAVSHEPGAAGVADRVVTLRDGQIVLIQTNTEKDHAPPVAARYAELAS